MTSQIDSRNYGDYSDDHLQFHQSELTRWIHTIDRIAVGVRVLVEELRVLVAAHEGVALVESSVGWIVISRAMYYMSNRPGTAILNVKELSCFTVRPRTWQEKIPHAKSGQ